ncbi:hypothetical protein COJ96_17880 [Bacillus sp. AFS073361]|uniref:hypothetical protein n=1 Tax=Bacillus sp. AFS073361 TaxID=2033511 RepID=UPI000BFA2DE4|nr:hypothetical protein [Bacillus sp. AFS073361]PFP25642.1 hypothetical protein COJ96_17880 [Bacillus sp. AFS073361]
MRLSDLQPKKNFSYIFIQFPGMKMNVPMLSSEERKAVKEEVALCLQLNSNKKVHQLYFVRTESIKPFDFTDEGIGAKAFYRVVKLNENTQNSNTNEYVEFATIITDEVKIVQKKTETGFDFVLMLNKREIGIVASMEVEVAKIEYESVLTTKESNELVATKDNSKKNKPVHDRRAIMEIFLGGNVFQDIGVMKSIRILLEGVKRKVRVFSPAALDFLGPGDQNQTILNMRGCK